MKVLIVDDEPLVSANLVELIEDHFPELEIVANVPAAKEALKYLRDKAVDLIFLDVEMPEMDGFEFLECLQTADPPMVIFTTGFSEYAVRAFKVNAVDYLLKPILPQELIRAVKRAFEEMKKQEKNPTTALEEKLPVFNGTDYLLLGLGEIIRLEGKGSYCQFILEGRPPLLASRGMHFFEPSLLENGFLRCHRSHLVNSQFIEKYTKGQGGYFTLQNGDTVPTSSQFKDQISAYLRNT